MTSNFLEEINIDTTETAPIYRQGSFFKDHTEENINNTNGDITSNFAIL